MIETFIRDVPDFPKPGILFKDITPLLQSSDALRKSIEMLAEVVDPATYDLVCGIESRGFIFGTALAIHVGKGFIPIRKPGKLPWKTASESYELEYGTDTIEIHVDAVNDTQNRVLMVDDLLATGGTMKAALGLVRKIGGEPVACAFVVELGFLSGREKLGDIPVHSLIPS
ncbi:MAG: adenine phosphoribosyltransferase [Planctomycetota bacterium]|nr:adenine phosphoribosyltransferase [Planctomycetota bacterium]